MEHRSTVRLPRGAQPPYRVFVNGVEQREGDDFVVRPGSLEFTRSLTQEGKLGFWRWALIALGIAGSYRPHETVDVQYSAGGETRHATGLEVVTPDEA